MDGLVWVLWLVGLVGSLSILFYLVRSLISKAFIRDLTKKCDELQELYKKTQLKINQLRNEYGEPEGIVAEGLQGLDIAGILQALQISPDMLKSLGIPKWAMPLIQGYIDKMSKGGGNGAQKETIHPRQV